MATAEDDHADTPQRIHTVERDVTRPGAHTPLFSPQAGLLSIT